MDNAAASAGFGAEIALCSPGGMFLGVTHTWCSCDVELSRRRRNEQVFTIAQAQDSHASSGGLLCSLRACNGTYLCAGSLQLEHERGVGTCCRPFYWRMMLSRAGCVALYSVARRAFLRNDLSLLEAANAENNVDECDFIETLPSCVWLCVPVPLKSEEGHADGYYSVTCMLHWGHASAVFLTEHSGLRERSVVKSLPCALSPAIRRIDGLLYEANMPGAADSSGLLCPVLSKITSVRPSVFYTQKLCFRSLEQIVAQHTPAGSGHGSPRLPLPLSLEITRRIIDIIDAVHGLGHVLLDATPSSFCEGREGDVASLQLTDMKNVMKLERKTYSTPASFVTKSGGRYGVPTGLFVMVPQPSLFLGTLHDAHCMFSSPEVLRLPGSVGTPADVFSLACIFVWCVTGAAPCQHMSPAIISLGCYSAEARALAPSLITAMHEAQLIGDELVPHSSAASTAIVAACSQAPALAKLMMAALSVEPEKRPGLEQLRAGVEEALARVGDQGGAGA